MSLSTGTRLGPYVIVSPLGRGGMGEVYRARDERLGRDVALKVLPISSTDAESRTRFDREARAVASLSHPHIVPLFDVGEQDGVHFVVIELVEGETLRDRLLRGPLPPLEAAELAAQVAEGLAAAHARGFVHRDVKPENIVITRDGRAKILDFGLVRAAAADRAGEAHEAEPTATALTEPGVISGTIGYMSPEQVRGEAVDGRSDIFALGCVLFEMLAGKRAFTAPSKVEALNAVLKEEPPPPESPLPEELAAIVSRCLAKRPENRYHSGADLAHDLRAAAGRTPSGRAVAAPAPAGAPRRRTVAVAAAAAAILALAGIGILRWRARTAAAVPRTLAVLPFRTIGGEAAPHFGLGLADSVIGHLASIHDLTVRPTSAISRYEAAPSDAITAGKELGVDTVLEGTLQKIEGTTRASLQLTDVSRGALLWSDRIDLPEGRLFEIQDAIARGVSERLRLELDSAERRGIGRAQPVPDDVLEAYFSVRGRLSEVIRMSPAERTETLETLDGILKRVPDFARALGARAYTRATFNFQTPTSGGFEAVLADSKRALELDPELAEPRLARAQLYWSSQGGWRFVDAVRELQAVIAQSPGLELGYLDLARVLHHYGWLGEARQSLESARRLNPTSAESQRLVATVLWFSGDLRRSLTEFRKIPSEILQKRSLGGRYQILQLRSQLEEPAETLLAEAQAWADETSSDTPLPVALLALERVRSGRTDISDLESRLAAADSRIGHFHHVDHIMAETYAQKGDVRKSVDLLRRSAATGLAALAFFDADPLLAPIRGSAPYAELRKEIERQDATYRAELREILPKARAAISTPESSVFTSGGSEPLERLRQPGSRRHLRFSMRKRLERSAP